MVALLALLALLALGACSASAGGPRSFVRPEIGSVPVVTPEVRLPFDDYNIPYAARVSMQADESRLLTGCLHHHGVRADVHIAGDYSRPHGPLLWGGPFGTLTVAHAERYGYQAAPGEAFALGPGLYLGSVTNLGPQDASAEVEKAFYGFVDPSTPPQDASGGSAPMKAGGCLAEVEKRISAPVVDLDRISSDVENLAFNDSRVEAAQAAWHQCMVDQGYSYATVDAPESAFALTPVDDTQVRTAIADATCTSSSGWANLYYAVLADYERQAIAADPNTFAAALASEQTRLAHLQQLTAG